MIQCVAFYNRFFQEPLPYAHTYSPVWRGVNTNGKGWTCSDISAVGSLYVPLPTVHTLLAHFLPILSYTFVSSFYGIQLFVRTPTVVFCKYCIEVTTMKENRLESHLQSLCDDSPNYEPLQATWLLNKRACSNSLKSVILHYPHFSLHDESHAQTVIANIERLLGNRIITLSPTDTWLLLHAAYAHDLGMITQWDKIETLWKSKRFQHFLGTLLNSADKEISEAARFVQNTGSTPTLDNTVWPLQAYRYVQLINAAYFRQHHAHSSQEYIQYYGSQIGLDFGHSDLIPTRLIKLLGIICHMHTTQSEEIFTLDHQTNGFGSDYAHPRLIAVLLRLGDLLDIDNGRFSAASETAFGTLPSSSVPHKEKHEATTHLLITPTSIEFRSDCPNQAAYLEARNFVNQLETELDFWAKYWLDIVPDSFEGAAPRLRKKELLLAGVQDLDGVADLHLCISQQKAFEIIEGSNLYENPFIFVREILQNAEDASKLQLWSDIISGTYQAWLSSELLPDQASDLQPYDIPSAVFFNYPISISLSTLENGMTQVRVTDHGTGISINDFKKMCKVGSKYNDSIALQEQISTMPKWLRPTAGFGIGLQSIFLLADYFEIDTDTGSEAYHATVQSCKYGGYLQLYKTSRLPSRGTTITVQFHTPESFKYSIGGETERYITSFWDPISKVNDLGQVLVVETIQKCKLYSIFPTHITCTAKSITPPTLPEVPIMDFTPSNYIPYDDHHFIRVNTKENPIHIWDTENYAHITIQPSLFGSSQQVCLFKGILVSKNAPYFPLHGLDAKIDVYGLDTKSTITLDRSSFTRDGNKAYYHIFVSNFTKILDYLISESQPENNSAQAEGYTPYLIWRNCSAEQQNRFPEALRSKCTEPIHVLSSDFEETRNPASECISNLENYYFFYSDYFFISASLNPIDFNEIGTTLTKLDINSTHAVIIDRIFSEAAIRNTLKTLFKPSPNVNFWLYQVSTDHSITTVHCQDIETRKILIYGLCSTISGFRYNLFMRNTAMRYCIPAIEKYDKIAVQTLPGGIAHICDFACNHIISPFTREEFDQYSTMSTADFVNHVFQSPSFSTLIDYVANHKATSAEVTQDDIKAQYTDLICEFHAIFRSSQPS